MSSAPALELHEVVQTFYQAGSAIEVLKGASLSVSPGEMVALVGPSGAGKSTLLQIAGLLERPHAGEVAIVGERCDRLPDRRRTRLRRERLGFIYQFHHLLAEFSALENVILPQMIAGRSKRAARERAREILARLGLDAREGHRPSRLSGGEQQRVAIARAIANEPAVLLADEPTGPRSRHGGLGVRIASRYRPHHRARRARRHPQHGVGRAHGPAARPGERGPRLLMNGRGASR